MSSYDDFTSAPDTSKPCFIYFISAGSTPIKIGLSDDPQARLNTLQTAHYQKLHLLFTIECTDRAQAGELERAFHRWYEESQVRNEWFNIAPQKIESDIRLLLTFAKAHINIEQHTSAKQLEKIYVRAENKLKSRAAQRAAGGQLKSEQAAQYIAANWEVLSERRWREKLSEAGIGVSNGLMGKVLKRAQEIRGESDAHES